MTTTTIDDDWDVPHWVGASGPYLARTRLRMTPVNHEWQSCEPELLAEEDLECIVCMEPVVSGPDDGDDHHASFHSASMRIKLCSCHATICRACIQRWCYDARPDRPTCPACRQAIDRTTIARALGVPVVVADDDDDDDHDDDNDNDDDDNDNDDDETIATDAAVRFVFILPNELRQAVDRTAVAWVPSFAVVADDHDDGDDDDDDEDNNDDFGFHITPFDLRQAIDRSAVARAPGLAVDDGGDDNNDDNDDDNDDDDKDDCDDDNDDKDADDNEETNDADAAVRSLISLNDLRPQSARIVQEHPISSIWPWYKRFLAYRVFHLVAPIHHPSRLVQDRSQRRFLWKRLMYHELSETMDEDDDFFDFSWSS
jgi:hypothetical protein